jgi:ParB family chromosome partitioning protein
MTEPLPATASGPAKPSSSSIEAKGKAATDNIATLKKGDMADRAAELITGTGWLPSMLRAA